MDIEKDLSACIDGEILLISIKPKYAEKILRGEKRIEFRRVWTKRSIKFMILYSTSPVKRIVAVASVDKVIAADLETLYQTSISLGSEVEKHELEKYLQGKEIGYGIIIGRIQHLQNYIDPKAIYPNFTAPQSYRYISKSEANVLISNFSRIGK